MLRRIYFVGSASVALYRYSTTLDPQWQEPREFPDSNSKKGGDLGWFEPSQMVKPFSDAVAAMEIGTFTHTPVHTQFGWHVIKLEDKRTTTPPTFESVKSRLMVEAQRKVLTQYVDQLLKQAKIETQKAPAPQAVSAPAK